MDTTAQITLWRPECVAELVLMLAPQGTREVQLPTEREHVGTLLPCSHGMSHEAMPFDPALGWDRALRWHLRYQCLIFSNISGEFFKPVLVL